jgi:hypothetical protein
MPLPALSPLSPLGRVLDDIERAIAAKLYYPALLVALTIPEICMALNLDRNTFVKEKHYAEFVDKYAAPHGLGITGTDCYRLRGGMVHRGNFAGHPKVNWTNVVFTVPESAVQVHALSLQAGEKIAPAFSLQQFCAAMIAAAQKWYEDHQNDTNVVENMNDLIRWCPNGLAPFVKGTPIVASGS